MEDERRKSRLRWSDSAKDCVGLEKKPEANWQKRNHVLDHTGGLKSNQGESLIGPTVARQPEGSDKEGRRGKRFRGSANHFRYGEILWRTDQRIWVSQKAESPCLEVSSGGGGEKGGTRFSLFPGKEQPPKNQYPLDNSEDQGPLEGSEAKKAAEF